MSERRDEAGTAPTRELGLLDATMIVMGSMIGSGVFITSAESSKLVGSPGWLLAAWAIVGLLTICGSICCAELAAMTPKSGGQYVFIREAYGRLIGFLFGWATFLVVQTGTIAAVSVAFAKFLAVFAPIVSDKNYLVRPIHLGSHYAIALSTQQLAAIGVILTLTITNTRGLDIGKWIQNVFTIGKTAALAALIVIGLGFGMNRSSAAWTSSWWNPEQNGWTAASVAPELVGLGSLAFVMILGQAMIGPLFSQTAWNNVTFTGGEVRDPDRTLPRGLILGCAAVVGLYLLANLSYVVVLPLEAIQHAPQERVATAAMNAILGGIGVKAMAAAILVSTFGCVNGLILAGGRVFYAMAWDGLFFKAAGATNRKHVPAVAIVAGGVWSILLTLPVVLTKNEATGSYSYGNLYGQLLEYIIPADLTFYALMIGALIIMRYKAPGARRPFRVPLYPLPAIVYLAIALFLIVDFLYLKPKTSGVGFAIVLSGVPVYLVWRAIGIRVPKIDRPESVE
jgi:APA family basic amino acid/polyamine antiporter